MNDNNKTKGLTWFELLQVSMTIVLMVFKIIGNVTCSWIWVFAPIWLPFVVLIVGAVIYAIVSTIIEAVSDKIRGI